VLCAEFGLSSSGKAEAHASEESCSTREAWDLVHPFMV
jgi:hypothetical protein